MMSRNDPCWCGSGQKWKKCHYPTLPQGPLLARSYLVHYGIVLKTPEQIGKIRIACQATAKILDEICKHAQAGVTTLELDELSRELHKKAGAVPATLGYGSPPYPMTICTSLNDVICHGIPDKRPLQNGDIVNIDASCILDGFFGDCSRMVAIGNITKDKEHVINVSLRALHLAIQVCKPGNEVWHIGKAIEDYARSQKCSVVNQFVGHGIGRALHEDPTVFNFGKRGTGDELETGLVIAIEPMFTLGDGATETRKDDSYVSSDGSIAAHFEHTVAITPKGPRVLTQ